MAYCIFDYGRKLAGKGWYFVLPSRPTMAHCIDMLKPAWNGG